jgi:hypothetical protein
LEACDFIVENGSSLYLSLYGAGYNFGYPKLYIVQGDIAPYTGPFYMIPATDDYFDPVPWPGPNDGQYRLFPGCELVERYYTNEVLRFRMSIGYGGSANGFRVVGTPLLKIHLTGPSGTQTRYAEFKPEFSVFSESSSSGYFEFHLLVDSTDQGIPSIGDLVCDENNTIQAKYSYYYYFYNNICGSTYPGLYSNMTRVRINTDGSPSGQNTSQSTILLKRSSVPDKVPQANDLTIGEVALNTNDAILYTKKEDGTVASIKDVLKYADPSKLPLTGTLSKLYITENNNKLYRWDGSQYVEMSSVEPQIFNKENISITENKNNLNIGTTSVVRLSATVTGLTITGFNAGSDSEIKLIYNAGINSITIAHNSPASSTGQKVLTYNSNNFSLEPNAGITILYDSISGAWRLF